MQTLQQKTRKFVDNYHPDTHSLTALRLDKVLRVGILGDDARMGRMAAHRNFGIYALFQHNCERSIRGCAHFQFFSDLIIAGASFGGAHISLIELVIECLPIVHLAVKTA